MRVRGVVAISSLLLAPLALVSPTQALAPVRTVEIGGTGTSVWPAYDESVSRFAIGTSPGTDGRVSVTASTADPGGTVLVDGRPVANGATTEVTGLAPGDEVNVQVSDAAGSTNQSFVYLPAGFPRLRAAESGTGPTGGHTLLGLASYLSETSYETAVDRHGVPVRVSGNPKNHDFKPSGRGDGHFTVAHLAPGSTAEQEGYQIDEYDARFRLVDTHTLARVPRIGLLPRDTDFHDVELLPDGRVVLTGYQRRERASGVTWLDAIIQVTDRQGRAQFTWSSKGHVKPTEGYVLGARGQDYAHLNSVQVQPNGDIVASFRNTGQVLRIATERRGKFEPGDVVWRLGGERNEFTFVGDPLGGFCAQHDARILPGGHLLLFDNGAERRDSGPLSPQTADMCPDPADPTGPRVARPQSRVVEYALDVRARTATLVWSHQVPGRYAAFAGSAQRLAGGNTLVGWWNSEDPAGPPPFVSEVTPAGADVWSLTAEGWFSYRAHRGEVPDRTRPAVQVLTPAAGATYAPGAEVPVDFTCTDTGGSNLATCDGDQTNGALLDTTPGPHTFTVVATDRAGNTRTRNVSYTVD